MNKQVGKTVTIDLNHGFILSIRRYHTNTNYPLFAHVVYKGDLITGTSFHENTTPKEFKEWGNKQVDEYVKNNLNNL